MTNKQLMAKHANAINTIFSNIETENIGVKIELKLSISPNIWIDILNKDSEGFVFFYMTKSEKDNENLNKLIDVYMQDDIDAIKEFSDSLETLCIDKCIKI